MSQPPGSPRCSLEQPLSQFPIHRRSGRDTIPVMTLTNDWAVTLGRRKLVLSCLLPAATPAATDDFRETTYSSL